MAGVGMQVVIEVLGLLGKRRARPQIQNATEGSYFGGQICGPVYKEVLEFALKTLQVPPTGKAPARLPVTFTP